ncbi:MAG: heme biosynthesis protein HemY [Limnohabitans sp.]
MRAALWLITLFGLASGAAWLAWNNPGSVTFFWPPFRIDLSLNLLLLVAVLVLVLVMVAQRALMALLALPRQAQRWRLQQKERAAHATLLEGMAYFLSGRYLRARKAAELAIAREAALHAHGESLDHAPVLRTLSHLLASEAAHALQDRPVRQHHLELAQADARQALPVLRAPLQHGLQLRSARWSLDDRDAAASQQQLAELPVAVSRRLVAMRIQLKAARLAGQPAQALETALLLAKHKAIRPEVAHSLVRTLALEWLQQVHDGEGLRRFWQGLPVTMRQNTDVACETAARCLSLKADTAWALQLLLEVWEPMQRSPAAPGDSTLRRLVQVLEQALAEASAADRRDWLVRIENAQRLQPRDGALLFLAGMVCFRQQLWGKAQQHLLQLTGQPGADKRLLHQAWMALAELAEQRQDQTAALQAWKQAAQLA